MRVVEEGAHTIRVCCIWCGAAAVGGTARHIRKEIGAVCALFGLAQQTAQVFGFVVRLLRRLLLTAFS